MAPNLSFTWNAPPSMPTVHQTHTWVVLHFYPHEGNQTTYYLDACRVEDGGRVA